MCDGALMITIDHDWSIDRDLSMLFMWFKRIVITTYFPLMKQWWPGRKVSCYVYDVLINCWIHYFVPSSCCTTLSRHSPLSIAPIHYAFHTHRSLYNHLHSFFLSFFLSSRPSSIFLLLVVLVTRFTRLVLLLHLFFFVSTLLFRRLFFGRGCRGRCHHHVFFTRTLVAVFPTSQLVRSD